MSWKNCEHGQVLLHAEEPLDMSSNGISLANIPALINLWDGQPPLRFLDLQSLKGCFLYRDMSFSVLVDVVGIRIKNI